MIYPTTTQYLAVMLNPKGRFRTLKNVRAVVDQSQEPIFRTSRHWVSFAAMVDSAPCSIRFFTSQQGSRSCMQLLEHEVFMDDGTYIEIGIDAPFDVPASTSSAVDIFENRIATLIGDRWGFCDESGRVVIDPIYDSVQEFQERRAVVCKNDLYGLIDLAGRQIIPMVWDEMSYDGSHLCYVERDALCGVVDRTGCEIVAPVWDWTGEFAHNMLLVEKAGKYGFVDQNGHIAIAVELDNATSFDQNGYATISRDGREYQIDTDQNRV